MVVCALRDLNIASGYFVKPSKIFGFILPLGSRQCSQIGRQYGINNEAAIAIQFKLNGKLIAALPWILYSSLIWGYMYSPKAWCKFFFCLHHTGAMMESGPKFPDVIISPRTRLVSSHRVSHSIGSITTTKCWLAQREMRTNVDGILCPINAVKINT